MTRTTGTGIGGTGSRGNRRAAVSVAGALIAVGFALALPAPTPPPAPAASPAGPPTLADVWPSAKPVTVESQLRDGSSLQPLLVLDSLSIVGTATSADLTRSKFVIRSADGTLRQLRSWTGQPSPTVAAAASTKDTLYWLERSSDDEGNPLITLWRAGLTGGQPTQMAEESSDLLYYDSLYDLQVIGETIVWAVVGDKGNTEIHSLPVTGGAVTIRALDGRYVLSAWPWVTSSSGSLPGDAQLLNLTTGQRVTVPAGPHEILTCTPAWCRVTTLAAQTITIEVEQTDRSQRRTTGNTSLTPMNNDVGLLDRFEVLASPASPVSSNDSGSGQDLWILDLTDNRQVLLGHLGITTVASRGSFLWWSTGNNETLLWHVLDLRQLS